MQKEKLTRKVKRQTLKNTYGSMVLPKGLILYHTSSAVFDPRINDPMMFFTFHPSEWSGFPDEVITKVELTKTVRLFFMVKTINRLKIISLLNTLTNSLDTPYKNLNKQYNINLKCYIPYLEAENLDGWFSTVENKTAVEVALINKPSYFKVLSTSKTNRTWILDSDYKNNLNYPLYTQQIPIKLHIHKKYQEAFDDYMRREHDFVFQIVLENAQIEYFDGPDKDILWKC